MKMFLISDNTDTYTGMRLAGVEGVVVHTADEVRAAFSAASGDPEIGIVLITELLAKNAGEVVSEYKSGRDGFILLEIPDRHGYGVERRRMTDFISTTIGLKLDEMSGGAPQGSSGENEVNDHAGK